MRASLWTEEYLYVLNFFIIQIIVKTDKLVNSYVVYHHLMNR